MTKGIRHPIFSRGLLFMDLPEMLLFQSKQNKSEATYFESIASFVNPDIEQKLMKRENNHSVRKLIDGDISEQQWNSIFGEYLNYHSIEESIANTDIKTLGGWLFLESNIKKLTPYDDEQQQYLDFLLMLCQIDKNYISISRKKDPENKQHINELSKSFQDWHALPNFDLNNNNIESNAKLVIALVSHWAALFEHFLVTEYIDYEPSTLNRALPEIDKKGNILLSNGIFITNFKNKWGEFKYPKNKKKITWEVFYQDIVRAKNRELIKKKDHGYLELMESPNTGVIKKTITRLRNGKDSVLTVDVARKELFILYEDYDQESNIAYELLIVFIQLFDNIQQQLIGDGVSEEFIVEQFARYPDYLKLVEKRFENYKETGAVTP